LAYDLVDPFFMTGNPRRCCLPNSQHYH
jgi:hypothetical protein